MAAAQSVARPRVRCLLVERRQIRVGFRLGRFRSLTIMRRQLTVARRIKPGDRVRLGGDANFRTVDRITGSPGRKSAVAAPLMRVILEGVDGYATLREDQPVEIEPRR